MLPEFDAFSTILPLLIRAAVIAFALSAVLSVLAKLASRKNYSTVFMFILPFGWIGVIVGYITGQSKESLVGALLAGLLTIVGALLSYAYSKDANADWRDLMPYSAVALAITAFIGLGFGQLGRSEIDEYEREYAKWKLQFEKAELPAMERRIRYRDCLDKVKLEKECGQIFYK